MLSKSITSTRGSKHDITQLSLVSESLQSSPGRRMWMHRRQRVQSNVPQAECNQTISRECNQTTHKQPNTTIFCSSVFGTVDKKAAAMSHEESVATSPTWQLVGDVNTIGLVKCRRLYCQRGKPYDLALFSHNNQYHVMEAWCSHMRKFCACKRCHVVFVIFTSCKMNAKLSLTKFDIYH